MTKDLLQLEDRAVLEQVVRPPDGQWAYGPEPDACADLYLPATRPRSAVLLLHGGYWRPEFDRTHLRPLAAAVAGLGHLAISLEYRRQPGHPDATVADVTAAWRALPELLAEHGLSDGTVVVAGHSAGGHLALWLAGQAPVPCLALAPVTDLVMADELHLDDDAVREFLGGPASGRPDLDPARRPGPAAPAIVVHGANDARVPVGMSRKYCASHPQVGYQELPDVDHFTIIDPLSRAWPQVSSCLARLAANPSATVTAGIE